MSLTPCPLNRSEKNSNENVRPEGPPSFVQCLGLDFSDGQTSTAYPQRYPEKVVLAKISGTCFLSFCVVVVPNCNTFPSVPVGLNAETQSRRVAGLIRIFQVPAFPRLCAFASLRLFCCILSGSALAAVPSAVKEGLVATLLRCVER